MKILSISAQKPNSTGSGIYLTELVNSFDKLEHENIVVAGIDIADKKESKNYIFKPVIFNSHKLPFSVVGMSDEMPYKSTRYKELTADMQNMFEEEFIKVIKETIKDYNPDIIICHHLYFLTSLVREHFKDLKIIGLCHGTDLRQLKKIDMQNDRIIKNIRELDLILVAHNEQKKEVINFFDAEKEKVKIIGTGYNHEIFNNLNLKKDKDKINIIFAGKISEKKGVKCLIKALEKVKIDKKINLYLAGGYSDEEEYNKIYSYKNKVNYNIEFLSSIPQIELAKYLNKSDIFVLPSFYEGLPLVLLEALACGLKVICTDLVGIKDYFNEIIPNNNITFIKPPKMKNVDEAYEDSLPIFINDLKMALENEIKNLNSYKAVDTTSLSWLQTAKRLINLYNE